MALNASGAISLAGTTAGQSIAVELGLSPTGTISLNQANVRTLAGVASGAITMPTNFWGKSSHVPFSTKVTYTANSTFVVPAGISAIRVKAWGASGGSVKYSANTKSGGGGFAQADVAVTAGNTILVAVGGGGAFLAGANAAGGTNGGGNGGTLVLTSGGGGYSGVFLNNLATQANARVIAGGSGGGVQTSLGTSTGGGGGGSSGLAGTGTGSGTGGTQTAGGTVNGVALQGGRGNGNSGGGGGGFWGGGGGAGSASAGGGGSGYVNGTNTTNTAGTTGGNVANSADSDYVVGKGNGVTSNSAGQPGYVVLYW
jgi:hypothetical protein